jgi:hypothetical protein
MLMHNHVVMRRLLSLSVSPALLLAFLMAPYQHVHSAASHSQNANHHHHDDAVVHTHFYTVSVPTNRNSGTSLDDSDGHHARSLDTFTTIPQAGFPAFTRPESRLLVFALEDVFAGFVEVTEPRGHDPPALEFSAPRAPPA